MKSRFKRVVSIALVLCLCLTLLPSITMKAEAAALSQSQFDAKLSSARATYPTGSQREEWSVNGTVVGWQCHGYGRWLSWYVWGVDFANGNGTGWTLRKSSSSSSYINSLVPGDVVRFRRISSSGVLKTWNHTIFITSIIGDTIYYTDCNSDGACTIKWEQSVSKSTLDSWLKLPLYGSEAATYGYIAHYTPNTLTGGTVSCNCSSSYAGTYICTTSSLNLTIRSGHGSSYSAIGSIPPGATVTVSKASGTSSSDWAHVTYNGVSGYASMEYLKKQGTNHAETPTIRWWISDTEYGDSVDNCKIGNRYYFCYRLYDSVTGKDWDEVSSNNYTVNIAIYNPDGSLNYDSTKSSDTGWISIFYTTAGTYTRKVVVDGDFLFEGSREFYVDTNPKKVHSSTNSISLNLSGTKSQTIYLWSSGYYSGNAVWNWSSSNSNISCSWGEWTEDNRLPLTVTANSAGTATLTLSLKDKDTGAVLDSTNIPVVVNVNTSTLSVNSSNSAVVSTGGEIKYFTYTPTTSGKYVIYSTGSEDTKVYLYNSSWTELDNDDDGGDSNNFRLEYSLTAGTKYTFGVKYYNSSKTGTIPFKFGKVFTVTYNANGGSGVPSAQSKDYGTNVTLSNTIPTRSGYTFLGWATSSTATSATYQAGSSFSSNENTTLYAVWKANTYTVSYNANGGSGAPSSQTKTYGVNLTLSSTKPTRTGYTFLGWATSSTATSATYQVGSSFSNNANTTLYAVWKANTYTVSYNANGGSGAPSSQTKTHGVNLTLSSTKPTRAGYTFLGWATSSTATSATYQSGGSFTGNANTTLYAVWKQGCDNGTHSYSYTATKAPTTSATGTLTGTCSKCSGTTTVTLPKLNTTDYNYSVRTAATCTVAGSGRYTWKTTTYGGFYFDVSISATGHNYSNGSCTRCGTTDPNYVIDQNAPIIMADTVNGKAGETVTVTVSMKNNPGFGGMAYDIEYDSTILELVSYEIGLGNAICTDSGVGTYTNKVNLQYAGTSNITGDGALVTLTFKIKASAPEGTALISIVPEDGTFFTYEGRNEKDFNVSCVNGGVKVVKYISGDINGDGKVNNRDAARLLQKLAGWDVDYVDATLDVNGDGKVNNRDAARILQYLAGWDVELH